MKMDYKKKSMGVFYQKLRQESIGNVLEVLQMILDVDNTLQS